MGWLHLNAYLLIEFIVSFKTWYVFQRKFDGNTCMNENISKIKNQKSLVQHANSINFAA